MISYGSICSGIEAASVAWHALGWRPAFFAEIDAFPSAVLRHRFPDVANLGDFTRIESGAAPVDLLVGGTPCQSFSVAGDRGGMDDARGSLALDYIALARRLGARWFLWENVPGALSSSGGRDFGTILGALEDGGYGYAWRVLDAQHFGLAQRRKRVFLVGHLGDWRPPAAVLFEPESPAGNRTETGSETAPSGLPGESPHGAGLWWDGGSVSQTIDAVLYKRQTMPEKNRFPAVWSATWIRCECCEDFLCGPHGCHAFDCECPAIDDWAAADLDPYGPSALRFLTPRECERLQGFPDDWTAIPWRGRPASDCPDGPRYKAIGNSMAVPVMRWIGERIDAVDRIVSFGNG